MEATDMKHLQPFQSRSVMTLPIGGADGWQLKRYAILADGKCFDQHIADAAEREAIRRLPEAGNLSNEDGTGRAVGGVKTVGFCNSRMSALRTFQTSEQYVNLASSKTN